MEVFLTGATGYIGSAVAEALQKAGHKVTGLARTPEKAKQLEARGIRAVLGNLLQPEAIAAFANAAGGVIHTANTNDANSPKADAGVVRAILEALKGTGKPFVYTSGVWVLGSTGDIVADEQTPLNPTPLVKHRAGVELEVLGYKDRGVRTVVIRPALVYGHGGSVPAMFTKSARETGAARYVGDGQNRWPFVDVEDLAQLYVLALEKAPPGSLYNAAHGPSYRVREVAEAASIGAGAKGKAQSWPLEEARKTLGAFADALVLDQRISSEKAKKELGWSPRAASVLDDLKTGSYAR
ncbi:MAG TPA: SDR family oxidoreductase [Candidatus Acidoferrales bacterium]|nr:SDR family oxidoreductase [Candidatus Acidoferrales bacterium]